MAKTHFDFSRTPNAPITLHTTGHRFPVFPRPPPVGGRSIPSRPVIRRTSVPFFDPLHPPKANHLRHVLALIALSTGEKKMCHRSRHRQDDKIDGVCFPPDQRQKAMCQAGVHPLFGPWSPGTEPLRQCRGGGSNFFVASTPTPMRPMHSVH